MRVSTTGAIRIFCSYSHKDGDARDALRSHLAGLHRRGLIEVWPDHHQITPGTDLSRDIKEALGEADLVLLLVSADFLATDYCRVELAQAMQRAAAGQVRIIPIYVRTCDWKRQPFAAFQGLPKDAQPIYSREDPDAAWTQVVEDIAAAAEALIAARPAAPKAGAAPVELRLPEDLTKVLGSLKSGMPAAVSIAAGWTADLYRLATKGSGWLQRIVSPRQRAKDRTSEEKIRLDVAHPPEASIDEAFDLAVAVRQPDSPLTGIDDMPIVESSPGRVYRPEEEDVIRYRIEIQCPPHCEVTPDSYTILLRRHENADPRFFKVVCHRAGKQTFFVNAYQEDNALAAQTRISLAVKVRVAAHPVVSAPAGDASTAVPQTLLAPAKLEDPTALALWQEKLDFFLQQEATEADPARRFQLSKQIEECRAKILELGETA